ncbi:Hypothetical protein SMAX5B_015000 [Scophthalmus maximus]|uniref:Uncharacterized protein n=1 Tax=Scophthalmus maximus TaxID=52904 RepID=A0A2U9C152_SCOMX|nr:Hypothetical protein SMAX5B_015000 [Scophthalmus maximus]
MSVTPAIIFLDVSIYSNVVAYVTEDRQRSMFVVVREHVTQCDGGTHRCVHKQRLSLGSVHVGSGSFVGHKCADVSIYSNVVAYVTEDRQRSMFVVVREHVTQCDGGTHRCVHKQRLSLGSVHVGSGSFVGHKCAG